MPPPPPRRDFGSKQRWPIRPKWRTAMADNKVSANLVPGVMRCAKCSFQLHRNTIYLGSGTIGPGDSKTGPCPNGCGPLWPVTWEQWATEGWEYAEKLHHQIQAAPPAAAGVLKGWREHGDKALAHISNALDDLDSSPDQRAVPLLNEAMHHVRQMLAAVLQPETKAEPTSIEVDQNGYPTP